ncbi:FMN reductase (NADPH) [Corynebacterium occultum]|uniref:FMN reductase (NADPH) n=1 Tax=Corynebacterium occultum TaxID=2675219 RepID=A0A6B8W1Z2_9CORY|nr:CE1759 family FMN reductase [Corynebacterium occultum]QGU07534.1 FMN reductase (NADPH) [Corynebacterium occultum]
MPRLTVISAGLSNPSSTRTLADQIAAAVNTAVTARGEALEINVIELKNLAVDLAHAMAAGGISSEALSAAKKQLSESDGLLVATPVFKASYTGLLKMFFDVLDDEAINDMPTVIAATAGTARHALVLEHALRPLLSYMRARVLPTGIFAATEDFGGAEGAAIERRIQQAAEELAELMLAQSGTVVGGLAGPTSRSTRERHSGTDLGEDFTSFSELLADYDGS